MAIDTSIVIGTQDCILAALAASSPLELGEIAGDVGTQVPGINRGNRLLYTILALADLLRSGDVCCYDGTNAFELAEISCEVPRSKAVEGESVLMPNRFSRVLR